MLHFVTSYMKQNKSRKQTLESAQSALEISFKKDSNSNKCFGELESSVAEHCKVNCKKPKFGGNQSSADCLKRIRMSRM